ncbi:MAG: putative transposase [Solirubrobacteraceae bacterium]|nr:putative transposase [Solirubrobacteraceae bacterium]
MSLAFGQQARGAGIAQSMGSRGDCFDNAVAESFFATLKKELIHRRSWPTKAELRTEVFEYIEVFYNRRRRHRSLGQLSPVQFETPSNIHQNKENQTEAIAAGINPCPPKRGSSTAQRDRERDATDLTRSCVGGTG